MHQQLRKLPGLIFSRAVVFYLACFFLIWHFLDYQKLRDNAVLQTMSRLTPPMDYFAEFVNKDDHYDRFKLMNCINYHQEVIHYFVYQKAESYGMIGFCYDRLGRESQAIASYNQAIAINPDFFWSYYDLGVIYYRKGQYSQAADYFHQALLQDPVKTLVLLSKSKVYNDVNLSRLKGPTDYLENLKQGHTQTYLLMMDSAQLFMSKSGPTEQHLKPRVRFF